MKSTSCSRAIALQRLQELGPEVVVAALGLDGLDEDGGDVVGVRPRRPARSRRAHCCSAATTSLSTSGVTGKRSFGFVDARPGELREEVGLDRVGVGEGQGVAGAAVEGLAEVEDLLALLARDALRPVPAHLPVEGRLERVLDAEGAALDEERVAHVRGHGQAAEGVDELRVLDAVEVGERRLELRHPVQDLQELRVLHLRVVVADRVRAEEGAGSRGTRARSGSRAPRRRGSSRSRTRGRSRRRGCSARGSRGRRPGRWVEGRTVMSGTPVACHGRGMGQGNPGPTSSLGRIATRAFAQRVGHERTARRGRRGPEFAQW